ncbi:MULTISPECIES: histone methylation protein DOT1-like protein [unclassified Duganella]|uniref:histone methylation protein DOT1-like protein n=1 Tax=unclassified Duganella TaxID=2636909 RepID=UPI000885F207|nr:MULTISPECIES: histone methylation protein DOT1-like protein [unclassified Duganella]SDF92829.1 Histone methylation protein DOT1 [Duganella sp. OV458]SDJ12144.1 Histone methylation protein DOT1 [Duganella sp. OV510]
MNSTTFRTVNLPATPVQRVRQPADIFEALLQSIQGGESHARPTLELTPDSPFMPFLEIGYALRACMERPARHDYLLQRLRPHLSVMVGTLPASIQPMGMLPKLAPLPSFRQLEEISDDEIHHWLIQEGGLIYGEMQRFELENYFDAVKAYLAPGGIMVDLGSGLGKVVMTAALSFPFTRCIGVELMNYRHRLAQERLVRVLTLTRQGLEALSEPLKPETPLRLPTGITVNGRHLLELGARIVFIENDMFKVDLRGASLVFLYSTCFGPLMDALSNKLARELPEGAVVTTTTYSIRHPAFQLLESHPPGTLSWTSVMIYRRVGPPMSEPAAETRYLHQPDVEAWETRAREELGS